MKKPKNYQIYLDKLKEHSSRLNMMLENGSFYDLPYWKRYIEIRTIKKLYNKLLGPITEIKLKYILAAASILVAGFACDEEVLEELTKKNTGPATKPSFSAPKVNPFNIQSVGYDAIPTFVDIDNDGDQDLFVSVLDGGDGDNQFFRNIGTKNFPFFSSPVAHPFNTPKASGGVYQPILTFADIDKDGDLDILAGDENANIYYYENDGSNYIPNFAGQGIPTGLPNASPPTLHIPTIIDIDGDGSDDVITGSSVYGYNPINFYKNDNAIPATFTDTVIPTGLDVITDEYLVPSFVDIDADGDFDLFLGFSDGSVKFMDNTGDANNPAFDPPQTNKFGLTDVSSDAAPTFVDIDNDGDFDIFVGDGNGDITFFENKNL